MQNEILSIISRLTKCIEQAIHQTVGIFSNTHANSISVITF